MKRENGKTWVLQRLFFCKMYITQIWTWTTLLYNYFFKEITLYDRVFSSFVSASFCAESFTVQFEKNGDQFVYGRRHGIHIIYMMRTGIWLLVSNFEISAVWKFMIATIVINIRRYMFGRKFCLPYNHIYAY